MNSIKIEKRNLEKKTQELRDNGFVPGTIYGTTIKSTPIKTRYNELTKATESSGEVYKVMSSKGFIFVKIHELQKDPVSHELEHFSLVQLPEGVENEVDIPVSFSGTPIGVRKGGTLIVIKDEITLNGKPRALPDNIQANVANLDIGEKLTVDDLNIPKKVDASDNYSDIVAMCTPPAKEIPALVSGSMIDSITKPHNDNLSLPGQVI